MNIKAVGILFIVAVTFGLEEQLKERRQIASSKDNNSYVSQQSEYAYVTLLYGDGFLLGVRVLGQSLNESKTKFDKVVIIAGPVQHHTIKTLEQDGWRIVYVDVIQNPGQEPQQNGSLGTYTDDGHSELRYLL
eukprot:TRINITY_DN58057_c0_g1_i1.p2 TRINITY_DN58057_c0_g1~~TRINITY_DN58057_c0_g1_i1.p2  ORF type:complete len:133 (+),score=9.24 TRINITY_DN58057_c0_g1_i1:125-523(+)